MWRRTTNQEGDCPAAEPASPISGISSMSSLPRLFLEACFRVQGILLSLRVRARQLPINALYSQIVFPKAPLILRLTTGIKGPNVCSAATPSLKEKGDRFQEQS